MTVSCTVLCSSGGSRGPIRPWPPIQSDSLAIEFDIRPKEVRPSIRCFLPARRYASAGLCDSDVSVRPSVPSVCHTPSESRIVKCTPSDSPMTLVSGTRRKIHKGSPQKQVPNEGIGFFRRFSTNMSSYLENGAF